MCSDRLSCDHIDAATGAAGIRIDARIMIVLGAVLFSTGGAAIKGTTLTAWQVAGFRSGTAFLALMLLLPAARRGWNWRIVPVAMAYAATLTLFAVANKYTTAASTIFLQSTAPLYLLFLGPWLLREHIGRRDLWFVIAMVLGLVLFFVSVEAPSGTAPAPLLGNVLGALAGICWALTLLGLRWTARSAHPASPAAAATLGNLFAFLLCAVFAFPVVASTPTDWWLILYLGVVQIGLAYALVTAAMHRLTAFEASLLLLVEPVLNPVWAWLFHRESPGVLAIVGGLVILTATLARTLQQRRLDPIRQADSPGP